MSVIPVDEPPGAASGAAEPGGFWQRLARAIDEYFVDRTRRVVPEITLRRSKHEVARCRRLMHKNCAVPAAETLAGRRVAQARPR